MGTHWKQALSDSQSQMPHHQKIPRCQQIKPSPSRCALHQLSSDCFKSYIWKAESKQGLWDKCHLKTRVHTPFSSPLHASQLYPLYSAQPACFVTANLTSAYQTARWHRIITRRQAWSDKGNRNDWGRCSLPPFWDHGVGNPSCHSPVTADRLTELNDPHIATEAPHWNSLRATAVMLKCLGKLFLQQWIIGFRQKSHDQGFDESLRAGVGLCLPPQLWDSSAVLGVNQTVHCMFSIRKRR